MSDARSDPKPANDVTPASDTEARARIRAELDRSFVVEASAGTGKTTELCLRIVAVLASGVDVSAIAAVTFTDKAAGELKLRLRSQLEIERRSAEGARRAALESALARLEEARVSTIHTFAADLLRERPVDAGIDPSFVSESKATSDALLEEAFRGWFEAALEAPGPGLRRALARRSGESKADALLAAARRLSELRHLDAAWSARAWSRDDELGPVVAAVDEIARLTELSSDLRHPLYRVLRPWRETAEGIARANNDDEREALLAALARERDALAPKTKGSSRFAPTVSRDALLERHARAVERLRAFVRSADADLATALHLELAPVEARYHAAKERHGVLDFTDLLLVTRSLLVESRDARAALQRRFSHLFVDEFQDTDPVQAAILLLLAGSDPDDPRPFEAPLSPGKLFIVGDPKQSIYRFRNADLGTYELVKDRVVETGGDVLHLSDSFRSLPGIQRFVNAAFADRMTGERSALEARYAPLEPTRRSRSESPSVIALPVPSPYSPAGNLTLGAVDASLPTAIGAFVSWLVRDSGLHIESPSTGELVPIEARHVCLLFRKLESWGQNVAAPHIEDLSSRGIRHVLVGGRAFYDRDEVEAVQSVLEAIEWPDDALHVVATLRGLFFGLSDEAIYEYRRRYRHLDPLRPPTTALPERCAEVGDALAILAALHRARNRRPVAETLAELLKRTRGHVSLALMPNGEQALANVLSLGNVARAHEARGALSFRSFVEAMRDLADRRDTGEAPILEEESDGVRIMTAHKAKGLEFPVVILADLTSKSGQAADRHVDGARGLGVTKIFGCAPWDLLDAEELEGRREAAEVVRLAYVAATRARDLLVVPFVGDEHRFPKESWLSPLLDALTPASPDRPREAPGFPELGDDTVLARPHEEPPSSRTIRPGLHATKGGDVLFLDPAWLPLERPGVRRVRGADLIAPKAGEEELASSKARLEAFRSTRRRVRLDASAPSIEVATVTAISHGAADEASGLDLAPPVGVEIFVVPRADGRPEGPRFGTLVHQVLATVELSAAADDVGRVARSAARLLGAPDVEAAAAAVAATNAMDHDLLRRAQAAEERGDARREIPITLFEDGKLVEGVIDLAFREAGAWLVVDFKTDAARERTRGLAAYGLQVTTYARAVEMATGEPARPILLFV